MQKLAIDNKILNEHLHQRNPLSYADQSKLLPELVRDDESAGKEGLMFPTLSATRSMMGNSRESIKQPNRPISGVSRNSRFSGTST